MQEMSIIIRNVSMTAVRQWVCIEVPCDADLTEDLAAEVGTALGIGVEITDRGIRFYLEGSYLADERQLELEHILSEFCRLRTPGCSLALEARTIEEEDWADRWKENFKPLRVGRHFIICPTWEIFEPKPGDLLIRMDPGRAFGTGHHETTRLCLEWLERHAAGPPQGNPGALLDVGTGSGILSMAAASIGFAPVVAVDNDPEAIEVAAENLSLNGLSGTIRLLTGSAADVEESFDVILANIQSSPLVAMALVLASRLKESGKLALSGILLTQKEQVQKSYEALALELAGFETSGEWCLMEFQFSERAQENER
jgi:ribosomal protein L11 methyltransferase